MSSAFIYGIRTKTKTNMKGWDDCRGDRIITKGDFFFGWGRGGEGIFDLSYIFINGKAYRKIIYSKFLSLRRLISSFSDIHLQIAMQCKATVQSLHL